MIRKFFLKIFGSIFLTNNFIVKKILEYNRPTLVKETFNYPSIINNGYLHIEQTFELIDYLKLKNEKGIVVDIGAADGIISLMFSDFFKTKIYSFEPIKKTFNQLLENTKHDKSIKQINKALGEKKGKMAINITNRITSSSFFPIQKEIKDEFLASNILYVNAEEVIISKLDEEIPKGEKVHLIKIDVQGFELEVLKGSIDTLKHTSIILVEMQNHTIYSGAPKYFEIDCFLREHNFTLYNMIPSIRKNNKLYEWDAIYVSSEIDKKINN
jgi:FkbM family methyltransferase